MNTLLELDFQRYSAHKAMPRVQYYFRRVQITPPGGAR